MDRSDAMGVLAFLLFLVGVASYLWQRSDDGSRADLSEMLEVGFPVLLVIGVGLTLVFGVWAAASIIILLLFVLVPVLEMLDLLRTGRWIGFFLVLATSVGMFLIWRTL